MIICHHCGHESRVMATRTVNARLSPTAGQRTRRSRTVVRLRQCHECRHRWKTIEVPVRRGSRIWEKVARTKKSRRAK